VADPILVLVCAAVTLAGIPAVLLYTGGVVSQQWRAIGALTALWAAVGVLGWATGVLLAGFAVLVAATGLVASSAVAAALTERVGSDGIRMLLAAAFSLLVFLPLSLVVFSGSGTWLYHVAGALDFGGSVPLALGTGTFALVVALLAGDRMPPQRPLALRGAMLFAVAAVAAAVGFELRVDALTPAIALHSLMTPAVAILAAAGIERVRTGRNTREGLAVGTLAGTAGALAACAYLETVSALMLGLVVGAVAETVFRGRSAAWRLATPLLVGGATGLLFLGVFALGPGFVYSGQLVLLGRQALLCLAAVVYAGLVSAAMLLPLRRRLRGLPLSPPRRPA
jgi:Amt family ammonium transporter